MTHPRQRAPELLVDAQGVTVTYEPTPRWLQLFIKSSITRPVHALQEVDLTLSRGEIVAVVGPNGAGKSTLFRVLMGLVTPSAGKAHVMGVPVLDNDADVRRRISFMPPDDRVLFHRQTCLQNLRFRGHLLGLGGRALESQIDDLLALVGLAHASDRVVTALSSGMRYRLMLAKALMGDPEILILDEPTGPLDPIAAHEFIELLVDLVRQRGIGALISSHRMDDVEAMPRRVLLLDGGCVRFDGSVSDLLAIRGLQDAFLLTSVDEAHARALAQHLAELGHVERDGRVVRITSDSPLGELLAHASDLQGIEDIARDRISLRGALAAVLEAGS